MAFVLYNAPQSTCSQRVRFVLNAKAIPFEEHKLNLLDGDQLKPEYLKINPNGVVPSLVHDGANVIDSSVIVEYLDELLPDVAPFRPKGLVEIAHMLKGGVEDKPDSFGGFSWQAPEIEATRARLAGAGLDVSELRTGRRPGTFVFTVRDGNVGVPTILLGGDGARKQAWEDQS